MSAIVQDVRYTLRALRRAPGFTLVALLTLALGIGGTTAIFTVVDAVVLRDLPYPEPGRLMTVIRADDTDNRGSLAPAAYLDIVQRTTAFAAVAGYRGDEVSLTGGGEPERLRAVQATGGYFDVFGAQPLVGRTFHEATDPPSGPRVAVIGEGLWQRRFGGRADIAGLQVVLDGEPTTILGVMPAWFGHPRAPDVWTRAPLPVPTPPFSIGGDLLTSYSAQYFNAIARLAPGVSRSQAAGQLAALSDQIARAVPEDAAGIRLAAVPFQDEVIGATRAPMLMLLGAVVVVLLIACANVASLLLARGAGRRHELAVRAALGASRGRIVRQLLVESLVLAGAGGALGVALAAWLVDGLIALAPGSIPRLGEVGFDPRVAAFATFCTALSGLVFGIVPALSAAAPAIGADLKDGGRSGAAGRSRARGTLVVAEVAMALVLLVAAGLLLSSFARLRAVDPGFRTSSLAAITVSLPMTRYDAAGQRRFYQALLPRLRGNPITAQSAIVLPIPLRSDGVTSGYRVVGRNYPNDQEPSARVGIVSSGYFATTGVSLVAGRDFAESDTADATPVVIVNRTLAEREWPGRDPIGEYLVAGGPPEDPANIRRVIGVAADARWRSLEAAPQATMYFAYQQFPFPFMGVAVRTDAPLGTVTTAVAAAVHEIDRDLPLGESYTVEQLLSRATGEPRFRALLVGSFAAVALLLAVVGIYGLISYTVAERIPEIGVRLALGATPADVRRLVLGRGLGLAIAGVGIGVPGALGASRLLQGQLYGVSAADPLTYAAVALLLLAVAALACWVPARRAMRIDPAVALRSE